MESKFYFIIFLTTVIISETTCDNAVNTRFDLFQMCILDNGIPATTMYTRTVNSTLYARHNRQWNLRIPHIHPLGFFLPTSVKDVQIAVHCGRFADVRVIPKSGGHSYESFSFGDSETLIIDFKKMKNIEVDVAEKTATIETGALAGEINLKLWKSGGFGLPMGNCHTVGIGGLTLGGGFSYYVHSYGLTIDSVIEMTMVDANGFVHTVNDVENPDLYWALRGVGSGYIGIVTSFKFKLFQASNLRIRWLSVLYDMNSSLDILESWQSWLKYTKQNAPEILSEIFFSGEYVGEFSQAKSAVEVRIMDVQNKSSSHFRSDQVFIQNVLHFFPPPKNVTLQAFDSYMDFVLERGYAPIVDRFSEHELEFIGEYIPKPRYVKQKTFFVSSTFDRSQLELVAEVLRRIPHRYVWVSLQSKGGFGASIPNDATSYVHRDSDYYVIVRYEGSNNQEEVKAGWSWVKKFIQQTEVMDNGGTYQNFVERDLVDYLYRYYGDNLPRLISVKQDWDPTNYFQNPESLPVYG